MIRLKRLIQRSKVDGQTLVCLITGTCAVFSLLFLPLAYRNAFFDINRYKVELIIGASPLFFAAFVAAFILTQKKNAICIDRSMKRIFAAILIFAVCCVISAALRGFEKPVLDGSEGRYSGLKFLLSCVMAFLVIASGGMSCSFSVCFAVFAAALVAFLGISNVCGLDLLDFYTFMKPEQKPLFISTIGNVDFYGGYLALLFPLAAGTCVLGRQRIHRAFALIASLVILLGIPASRVESACFIMHLSLLILLSLCADSYLSMGRVSLLCAAAWGALPCMYEVFRRGNWDFWFSGVLEWLCYSGAAYLLCLLWLSISVALFILHTRGAVAPGRRRALRVLIAFILIFILVVTALLVYCTLINPQLDIGVFEPILRFNDDWGTRRGFVYIRAMRALSDYSPAEWLFGKGVDLTRRILGPYMDNPEIMRMGVFNDAHCQPLQFLLTIGLLGMLSLIAFHVMLMIQLYKKSADDILCMSCFVALCAYVPLAFLHVAQPILLITYFSVAALGASRLINLIPRRGSHES